LQLRTAIFASKLKLTIHFLTAAATTALLLWASHSYGQLKLSEKAKDAKASAAFWRDALTLFSHVLEAVAIIPQADIGGWTSFTASVPVASFSFDTHVLLRVLYRAFDLAIFVFDPKSAVLLKSSNLIPLLKLQTIRHLVALFLVSAPLSQLHNRPSLFMLTSPLRSIGTITEVSRVLSARVISNRIFQVRPKPPPPPPPFCLPSSSPSHRTHPPSQYLFPLYFSILAYDYISSSAYGEALGVKPGNLHEAFIKPYFPPKLILGLPPSIALNVLSIIVAITCSFFLRIHGMLVLLGSLLWVLCYAKAAPVQGNVQLLHDALAPWLTQVPASPMTRTQPLKRVRSARRIHASLTRSVQASSFVAAEFARLW
jgi:hypothetical protein